jgi:hypothetical protein
VVTDGGSRAPRGANPATRLDRGTLTSVDALDRDVLEFIGDQGKTGEQVADRFPVIDLELLVRAGLVRPHRTNPVTTHSRSAPPPADPTFYVLTSRGAEAIGLDPHTLHSD